MRVQADGGIIIAPDATKEELRFAVLQLAEALAVKVEPSVMSIESSVATEATGLGFSFSTSWVSDFIVRAEIRIECSGHPEAMEVRELLEGEIRDRAQDSLRQFRARRPHKFYGTEILCGMCGYSINSTNLHLKEQANRTDDQELNERVGATLSRQPRDEMGGGVSQRMPVVPGGYRE